MQLSKHTHNKSVYTALVNIMLSILPMLTVPLKMYGYCTTLIITLYKAAVQHKQLTVNQLNAQMTFTFYYLSIALRVWGIPSVALKYFNSVAHIVTGNYLVRYIFKDYLRQAISRKDIYNSHDKD